MGMLKALAKKRRVNFNFNFILVTNFFCFRSPDPQHGMNCERLANVPHL